MLSLGISLHASQVRDKMLTSEVLSTQQPNSLAVLFPCMIELYYEFYKPSMQNF